MPASTLPGRDAPPRLRSYEEEHARHRLEVPARFNAVLDIIEPWAAEDPDAEALLSIGSDGEEAVTHTVAELARETRRTARALQELGVEKGQSVFVMLPRVPAWYFAMLGAMRIGAVPMPAPGLVTSHDIAYRIRTGEAVAAVTDAAGAEKLDAIGEELPTLRHRICWSPRGELREGWVDFDQLIDQAGDGPTAQDPTSPDDPLLLYFTSGTVGMPKMVLHPQTYALGHVGTARFWHDLRPGDRHWTVTDTGWAKAAWGGLFGQWHERATVVQAQLGKPDADRILTMLRRHRITSFCAPPTLYRSLVLADLKAYDLSTLRHCTSAGEPLNPEVIRVWTEGTGGLTVYDGYGQTETTCLVANYRTVPVRPGSMGKPMPGYDVDVVAEDGKPMPNGEVGDIAVRAEPRPLGLFGGYAGNPVETANRFRSGWYYTGDRASRDADGYIWFEGRDDDVITSSAYRIGPFEVESALVEHPAVAEAAVVGKPDPARTELVCAFVILTPGYQPSSGLTEEIQDHAKRVTAPYKYPREIVYVNELPKTVSGKIRRVELREWLRTEIPQGVERPVS
ncbi:MAG: AMP-binding protein [Actinomycetota bacterium]|nr:AMP-binding protein [Actinomycetota bacterium]